MQKPDASCESASKELGKGISAKQVSLSCSPGSFGCVLALPAASQTGYSGTFAEVQVKTAAMGLSFLGHGSEPVLVPLGETEFRQGRAYGSQS